MDWRADIWGDRRVHAARLACLLVGHRFGEWSEPVEIVWRGAGPRQRCRACLRCPRVEFDTIAVGARVGD